MADPKETLAAGRLIARHRAPYLRAKLLSYAVRSAPGLGTIGITHHGIVLCDFDWIEKSKITPEQAGGLWIHESLHDLMRHHKRCGLRDPRLFNIAGDLAINHAVLEMGAQLPPGGMMPELFGFERGLTADEYYELLRQEAQKQAAAAGESDDDAEGDGEGQDGDGQQGQNGDGSQGQKKGKGKGKGGGQDEDHDHDGGGHANKPQTAGGWCGSCAGRELPNEPGADDPDGRGEGEQERLIRQTAELVRQEAQKGQGKMPAMLRRWAEEALKPPRVPWRTKLARAARRAIAWRDGAVQHRFDAPSRRQAGIGYGYDKPVMPRLRMPVPRVAIVVDTSGSMGDREMSDALKETSGILKAVNAEVEFLSCDAKVHGIGTIRRIEDAAKLLHGGGGTDFRPAFKALETRRPRPEVVVFATDGCGPAPAEPPAGMKVIWLLIGPYRQVPATWGEVIEIDPKEEEASA